MYDTTGEPNEEDKEGGGTEGYDSVCKVAGNGAGGFELREPDEGGVVKLVPLLTKLAGLVEAIGEKRNGDSEEEGECESGVFVSEALLVGRWICDGGRGIGTPCVVRDICEWTTEVPGDDRFEMDLRCVGCE